MVDGPITAAGNLGSAWQNPVNLSEILKEAKTIVIVGCSGRRARPSYSVSRYLIQNGFRVIPVNPNYDVIHDQPCYSDLASVPSDVGADIVNIFRNPRHSADVVRAVIEWSADAPQKPLIWTQLGVSTAAAEQLALDAGFYYVTNRCIMMEHIRIASGTAERG